MDHPLHSSLAWRKDSAVSIMTTRSTGAPRRCAAGWAPPVALGLLAPPLAGFALLSVMAAGPLTVVRAGVAAALALAALLLVATSLRHRPANVGRRLERHLATAGRDEGAAVVFSRAEHDASAEFCVAAHVHGVCYPLCAAAEATRALRVAHRWAGRLGVTPHIDCAFDRSELHQGRLPEAREDAYRTVPSDARRQPPLGTPACFRWPHQLHQPLGVQSLLLGALFSALVLGGLIVDRIWDGRHLALPSALLALLFVAGLALAGVWSSRWSWKLHVEPERLWFEQKRPWRACRNVVVTRERASEARWLEPRTARHLVVESSDGPVAIPLPVGVADPAARAVSDWLQR